jgi:lysyl-tRNA synthetase class I
MGQERGPRLGAFIRLATPEKIAHALRTALHQSAGATTS